METRAFFRPIRAWSPRAVTLCGALAVVLLGSPGEVSAQARTLPGVWTQVITPRNCATNEPLPVPPFRALYTFHRDGTLSESVGTLSFAPGQRSNGHGTWAHAGGLTFRERTIAMILFNGGIYQAGWQVITRTITMTDANHYTSSGSSQLFDLNGQLYLTACATSAGERVRQRASELTILLGMGDIETMTLPTDAEPHTISFSPDGSYAYVSNLGNGDLIVVRAEDRQIVATLDLGATFAHDTRRSPECSILLSANRDTGS